MPEPTLYRATGRFKGLLKRLVVQGALVPVEPCEHTDEAVPNGRIDGHTLFKGKNFDGPDSENWCEGAGIGGDDVSG